MVWLWLHLSPVVHFLKAPPKINAGKGVQSFTLLGLPYLVIQNQDNPRIS